ncbi:Synaptonemal complex protein, partial [Halocaridina rubra]
YLLENYREELFQHFEDIGTELLSTVVNDFVPLNLRLSRARQLCKFLQLAPNEANKSFRIHVKHLFSKLPYVLRNAGDYDFQTNIVEAIFRMTSSAQRAKMVTKWFPYVDCTTHALFIRIIDFDPDCRHFLNSLNKSLGKHQGVFSIPCEKACIGQIELLKPQVASYEKFWIDFNMGSRSILILCQKKGTKTQVTDVTI